jgi:hypothetical protein
MADAATAADAAAAGAAAAAAVPLTREERVAELMGMYADPATCQQQVLILRQQLDELALQHRNFQAALDSPEQAAKTLAVLEKDAAHLRQRIEVSEKQKASMVELLSTNAKADTSQQEKLQNVLDKLRADKGIYLGQMNNHRSMLKDILVPRQQRALKKEMQEMKEETEERLETAARDAKALLPKIEANLPAFKVAMGKLDVLQGKLDKREATLAELTEKKNGIRQEDIAAQLSIQEEMARRDAQEDVLARAAAVVEEGRRQLAARVAGIDAMSWVVESALHDTLAELQAQIEALRRRLAELRDVALETERHKARVEALKLARDGANHNASAAGADLAARNGVAIPALLAKLRAAADALAVAAAAAARVDAELDELAGKLAAARASVEARQRESEDLVHEAAAAQAENEAVEKESTIDAAATLLATRQQALAAKMMKAAEAEGEYKSRWERLRAANGKALEDRAQAKAALAAALAAKLQAAAQEKEAASQAELRELEAENAELARETAAADSRTVAVETSSAEEITAAAAAAQELTGRVHAAQLRLRIVREEHVELYGDMGTKAQAAAQAATAKFLAVEKQREKIAELKVRTASKSKGLTEWAAASAQAGAEEERAEVDARAAADGAVVESSRTAELLRLAQEHFAQLQGRAAEVTAADAASARAGHAEAQRLQEQRASESAVQDGAWAAQRAEAARAAGAADSEAEATTERVRHSAHTRDAAAVFEVKVARLLAENAAADAEATTTAVAQAEADAELMEADRATEDARLALSLANAALRALGVSEVSGDGGGASSAAAGAGATAAAAAAAGAASAGAGAGVGGAGAGSAGNAENAAGAVAPAPVTASRSRRRKKGAAADAVSPTPEAAAAAGDAAATVLSPGDARLRDILSRGANPTVGSSPPSSSPSSSSSPFLDPVSDLLPRLAEVHRRMAKAFPGAEDLGAVKRLDEAIAASSASVRIRAELQAGTASRVQGLFRGRQVSG